MELWCQRSAIEPEQVQFVTIRWVLEYSPIPIKLGHIVWFYEIGDRSARILDLLIPITEWPETYGTIGVEVVVPMSPTNDTSYAGRV